MSAETSPGLPEVVAGIVLAVLIVYVLLGGADFGGGVWDLLATGPRAARQREAVSRAIGPIWEANHVWMIVAVVILFTAFPAAFSAIMTALHIPITLMLVGIVLRGSSFVFRKVDAADPSGRSVWQQVFAISSLITPVMIGVIVGTLSTPAIDWRDGIAHGGFVGPWLQPVAWIVGLFTVALFAWLAAIYLTLEADDAALREDFRSRALISGAGVALAGGLAAALWSGADPSTPGLEVSSPFGLAEFALGIAAWVLTMGALATRRFVAARVLGVLTTTLVLVGWGWAQYPWLVPGSLTIRDAAAPAVTLKYVIGILAAGSVLLVPAFGYLYLTFKGGILLPRGSWVHPTAESSVDSDSPLP